MNIGVTGNFLSGKTSVSTLLAENLDYDYFSCDQYVHVLYKKTEIKKKVVDTFGKDLYIDKKVQIKVLSDLVFGSTKNLKKLESIIIPCVEKEIKRLIGDVSKNHIFEIPLMYENNLDKLMDACILVETSKERCITRASARGFSEKDYEGRIKNFFDNENKKKKNPIIINNDGSLDDLKIKVNKIADKIKLS